MTDVAILGQIAKIRDFEKGYWASHVINTGFRVGLLHALAESIEGVTVQDLAVRLMLYEPYLKIWCQTAYHFEILDCDEKGRFKLQPFLSEILGLDSLIPNDPAGENENAGSLRQEGNDPRIFDYMRTGRTSRISMTPETSFVKYRAAKSMTTIFTSMIFPHKDQMRRKLEEGCKLLDIGCGSADLIIDFAHIFKNSVFVGVDSDVYGIEKAARSLSTFGLEDRVMVENLGGEEIHYHEAFEMVSLILTLHEILPEVRFQALARACQALKQGGVLLILDYPYPGTLEDFRNPRYDYGIIEQYFEAISGVVHLSAEEQDKFLSKAGFKDVERISVGDRGMLDFITATKFAPGPIRDLP
jgi:ubiquinone/menaquinone biosynthesis C-methylase UbiE